MRAGTAEFMIGILLRPNRLSMPESSLLARLRWVSLAILALSVMLTLTVRMSPTWWARWSLKKAREPLRQSELGLKMAGCGVGIGICTGFLPALAGGVSVSGSA